MNKYLVKIAKAQPIKRPKKPTLDLTSMHSLERALESTPRPKSVREAMSDKATQSSRTSARSGKGDVAADAVKAMQRAAQTPGTEITKQRLK